MREFPRLLRPLLLVCLSMLLACGGEEAPKHTDARDARHEVESRRVGEPRADWTAYPERFELTLWTMDCIMEPKALELVSPTALAVTTAMLEGQVACRLGQSFATYEIDVPEGMSTSEPVVLTFNEEKTFTLWPPEG